MMYEYGIIINGQLLAHKERRDGDKPIVKVEPPIIPENHYVIYSWKDDGDGIIQVWEIYEGTDEPEPEEEEASEEDYKSALNALGVNTE